MHSVPFTGQVIATSRVYRAMKHTMNFGSLTAGPGVRSAGGKFAIAVLGDFSGRANRAMLDTGAALAGRKPCRVDVDNLDATIPRMGIEVRLPIANDGGNVEVVIESMDDFHPDRLYQRLDIFQELAGLRRRLKHTATFPAAAKEVQSWAKSEAAHMSASPRSQPRGTAIPHGKLDDFARLIGRDRAGIRTTPASELIKQIVAPHIVAAPSPQQEPLIAAVDEALTATMRRVLHHPDFQALESIWRSVELLTRELETNGQLQIWLYDISAEELAADLSVSDRLAESGLHSLLVEMSTLSEQQGPYSVVVGNYIFEQTPPHAELLGRIGKIAVAAQAPFIAAISVDCLKAQDPDELHPLIRESWNTLHAMPHAHYLGLTVPRFLLRWPYGARTEPIESFRFEEFTPQTGLKGMLWANGSILAGLLLGQTFSQQGLPGMHLGTILSISNVPLYYYTDADGDQIALPSTERLVSESMAAYIADRNFMPVVSIRGRPEVHLGGFHSLHGEELAGPWSPRAIEPDDRQIGGTAEVDAAEEIMTVEAFEAAAAAEAARELDAALADIGSPAAEVSGQIVAESPVGAAAELQPSAIPHPSKGDTVDELDALLAALAPNETDQTARNADIDPDLAALLADL